MADAPSAPAPLLPPPQAPQPPQEAEKKPSLKREREDIDQDMKLEIKEEKKFKPEPTSQGLSRMAKLEEENKDLLQNQKLRDEELFKLQTENARLRASNEAFFRGSLSLFPPFYLP
jgi:hypothetical protein